MRYLGIDYGEKRVGIAVSDEGGRIAFPLKTAGKTAQREIKKIVKEYHIGQIIVGLPKMRNGRETEETRRVRHFISSLKKNIRIPIVGEDELLTTKIVAGEGIDEKHKDSSAAALILQSYLDKKNLGGSH